MFDGTCEAACARRITRARARATAARTAKSFRALHVLAKIMEELAMPAFCMSCATSSGTSAAFGIDGGGGGDDDDAGSSGGGGGGGGDVS